MPKQAGSQFWGTGPGLTSIREDLDPIKARALIRTLGTRLFGKRYDYSNVEFRGLYLAINITDNYRDEELSITPFDHLTSEDGRGY